MTSVHLAVSHRPLTAEDRVRSQDDPCVNCGGQGGLITSVFDIIATTLYSHTSLVYHRRYKIFAIGSVVK
jgi:hypothetical protein